MKECLAVLISMITKLDKKSLFLAVFPRSMKSALIKPLTKSNSLEANIQNNYRHVSNVTFVSKVIGRGSDFFLSKYLVNNNDIMMSNDQSKPELLLLLVVSAEFDMVDYILFSLG